MSDSDLPASADPAAAPNLPEYSVSEISGAVKRTLEDTFGYVRVRGEVSGLTRARSGHVYLSLKDDKSVLDAVIWRGNAGRLRFRPEDGLEVVCTGRITSYAARSRYQLVVEAMEPAGVGALMALLEERRRKLAAEGLFDDARKQPLPFLPRVIGVVTSPTGAVIRDILHRLRDRFPSHVLLWPVLVQGDGAAEQVAAAIHGFNRLGADGPVPRPDLLIVARGGGSVEDLWAFNEEIVVRAAADSAIPLISAVGHETDTTLIDFASDRRAPTPTAAAEIAVPVRAELVASVLDLERRLQLGMSRLLAERRRGLEGLVRGLRGPQDLLAMAQQRWDDVALRLERALVQLRDRRQQRLLDLSARLRPLLVTREIDVGRQALQAAFERLTRAQRQHLRDAGQRLASQQQLLEAFSYQRVLERGFAVVSGADGTVIKSAGAAAPGLALSIRFHDGAVGATVTGEAEPSAPPARARRRSRGGKSGGGAGSQGDLF